MGRFEVPKAFTSHNIGVVTGDLIYIFSDGFVDQFDGDNGKKFKAKALSSLILSNQNLSLDEQKKTLYSSFEKWRGSLEQIDDVCMIGVRIP
jgi:serine phosphatase RsbU (regulator of sigma subunit)